MLRRVLGAGLCQRTTDAGVKDQLRPTRTLANKLLSSRQLKKNLNTDFSPSRLARAISIAMIFYYRPPNNWVVSSDR
jgi:hypothetical protein